MSKRLYFTQCVNFNHCGHVTRLEKPAKWTCDECLQSTRRKTIELPAILWPQVGP